MRQMQLVEHWRKYRGILQIPRFDTRSSIALTQPVRPAARRDGIPPRSCFLPGPAGMQRSSPGGSRGGRGRRRWYRRWRCPRRERHQPAPSKQSENTNVAADPASPQSTRSSLYASTAGVTRRSERMTALGTELDFAFDFHRNIERQLGHADRASGVGADVRAEEFEQQIGEAVDDARLLIESGRRIHHSEHAGPGGDAIQISQRALQTAENRERRQARCNVTLGDGEIASDLAERFGERAVGRLRRMAGNESTPAGNPHELKWQQDTWRRHHRGRQDESKSRNLFFDFNHY